jgi:hypothetical protein
MNFNYNEINNILKKSFFGAFQWKLWKWLLTGSVGILISALTIGEKFFHLSTKKSILYAGIAILILFILRFTLIFIKESLKYFHEVYTNSVYGDAIILLKESFATAHYYRKTPGHDDKEFMNSMIAFCNNLKVIYDKITKSNCSVSLKVPLKDDNINEHSVLMNLTRDVEHSDRDTDRYKNVKHTIIGNTAFSYCIDKVIKNAKKKAYINNSINETPNYDNTSKECYKNEILPYNSELVYPIVPAINVDNKTYYCHGFICIDSDKKNAFNSPYVIGIIEGVADGIYDIISERNKLNNQNSEK